MKHLFVILLFVVVACSADGNKREKMLKAFDDAYMACFQLPARPDTAKAKAAVELAEELKKSADLDAETYLAVTQKEGQLLAVTGKYSDALKLMEKAMLRLDENDIRRLQFFAVKYKREGSAAKAEEYFAKALKVCDDNLSKQGYASLKAELLVEKGDVKQARSFLKEYVATHNDDIAAKSLYANFDLFVSSLKKGEQLMQSGSLSGIADDGMNDDGCTMESDTVFFD